MSYTDMAEDVVAFMEDIGLDKGIFLGHSMGGKLIDVWMVLIFYPDGKLGHVRTAKGTCGCANFKCVAG